MAKRETLIKRRARRVRSHLRAVGRGRPRLSVYRSNKHIYVQVIDDGQGVTLASASTLDGDIRTDGQSSGSVAAAIKVGELIASRAKSAGIGEVVFDRGSYLFHGRVKALAEAARAGGLRF
jgi:large subunit ribosomal protein L18